MKRCGKCAERKPLAEFGRDKRRKDGLHNRCKECVRAWRVEYQRVNPLAQRRGQLKFLYGITPEDYDRMLAEQGGGCAICGAPPVGRPLAVDHDHATNQVRGLLCTGCNAGLGCFKDNTRRLSAAVQYLFLTGN